MNRVTIQATVFENYPSGDKTLGFRAHDGYGQSYDNTWETIPFDDLDILRKVVAESSDQTVQAMLDFVVEHQVGLYIGGEYYEWDQIEAIFAEED